MQNAPSRQMQEELKRFQNMGQQLEILAQQIFSMETAIKEKDSSIEELESCADDVVVYKQVGGILIKSGKSKVLEGLKDEKTTLEMRKKTLERNETSIKKKFEEMRVNLQSKIKSQQ